jgi:hypothetical protein
VVTVRGLGLRIGLHRRRDANVRGCARWSCHSTVRGRADRAARRLAEAHRRGANRNRRDRSCGSRVPGRARPTRSGLRPATGYWRDDRDPRRVRFGGGSRRDGRGRVLLRRGSGR